jgi:hypothetical protein
VSRVGENLPKPDDPLSLVQYLADVQRVLDSEVEFGHPTTPYDEADATVGVEMAGDMTATRPHNGTLQNIRGSWVEVEIAAAGAAVTFTHNLGLPVVGADEPNVRWLFTNFRHSGVGATGVSTLTLDYDDTLCTVAADNIQLVLRSPAGRTIAAGANAVKASVFFVPAVRWP